MSQSDFTSAAGAAPESPPRNGNGNGSEGRRKKIFLIGGAILLLLGLGVGLPWYLHARHYVSTDDAFIRAHVVYISPRVAAQVRQVLVLDNQFVPKGALLVKLDPRDYQAQVDKIKALVQEAQAGRQGSQYALAMTRRHSVALLDEARAQVAIAQTTIATAQAAVAQAQAQVQASRAAVAQAQARLRADQANAVKAVADYQRYASLLKTGDVTPNQVDSYRAAAISAQAYVTAAKKNVRAKVADVAAAQQAVLAAHAQLHQARAERIKAQAQLAAANIVPEQVGQKQSNYSSSAAKIEQLKAELRQAELNLSYCTIRAPAAGYVTKKSVEPGDYVAVGQDLLAIVRPKMWVIANFKETDLTYMRPGDPAWITVDAYPSVPFKGYVQSIQAGTGAAFSLLPPENATGNYVKVVQRVPVKILFQALPRDRPYLADGMSAEPEVKVR